MYGIAIEYVTDGCIIYYGNSREVIDLITQKRNSRIYGTFYNNITNLMDQIAYLKMEKENVKIHKLEKGNVA